MLNQCENKKGQINLICFQLDNKITYSTENIVTSVYSYTSFTLPKIVLPNNFIKLHKIISEEKV